MQNSLKMNLKTKVEHIFFDLDHTLWDFDKNSGLAFQRVFSAFNIGLELQEFLAVYEPINLEYWSLYREDKITKKALRRGRLNNAFKAFNMQFDQQVIDQMAHAYIEELPKDNYLFSGAIELLEHLHGNYKMHIITNGFQEVQHKKLANSGINHFFKTVTTSEDAGVKKPNPLIFNHALNISGAKVGSSVMIGDSFQADIMGAQALGFKTVFFNIRDESIDHGGLEVNQLSAIKNMF